MFTCSEAFCESVDDKQPSSDQPQAIPWLLIVQALLPIVTNCFNSPQSLGDAKSQLDKPLGRRQLRRAVREAEREEGRRFTRAEREEFIDALRQSLDELHEDDFQAIRTETSIS